MLKTTFTKLKRVCSIALIPRILKGDGRYTLKKIEKRYDVFSKAKSTGSKDKDPDSEKQDIPWVLSDQETAQNEFNKPDNIDIDSPHTDKLDRCKKCERIIAEIFIPKQVEKDLEVDKLNATTARQDEETLAQKIEVIEETPLVEAAPQKTEGFNTPPKVLGHISALNFSNTNEQDEALDELAKRCLNLPTNQVDDYLLKEMENLGLQHRHTESLEKNNVDLMEKSKPFDTIIDVQGLERGETLNCAILHNKFVPFEPLNCNKYNLKHATDIVIGYKVERNQPLHLYQNYFCFDSTLTKCEEPKQFPEYSVCFQAEDPLDNVYEPVQIDPYGNRPLIDSYRLPEIENIEELTEANEEEPTRTDEKEEIPFINASGMTPFIIGDVYTLNKEIDIDEDTSLNTQYRLYSIERRGEYNFFLSSDEPPEEERPFNTPNTAISSTFPQPSGNRPLQSRDTAISANQDPTEYHKINESLNCVTNPAHKVENILLTDQIKNIPHYTLLSTDQSEPSSAPQLIQDIFYPAPLNYAFAKEKQQQQVADNKVLTAATNLKEDDDDIPLTELLRRVRQRNQMEYCKEFKLSESGTNPPCLPPFDKSKKKEGSPEPCKPKKEEPPACPPCPSPCPPKKKDPCAKFSLLDGIILDSFILMRFTTMLSYRPLTENDKGTQINTPQLAQAFLSSEIICKVKKLGKKLSEQLKPEDLLLVRDYEPWSPIPSWPIPKKVVKKPFVCPKEGCKLIPPPRLNPPCKENPCINFPKKTFAPLDLFSPPIAVNVIFY